MPCDALRFWDLVLMAWLDEILRNFLWVPLTAYTSELRLEPSTVGTLFALNVGMRFFPNFLVTQIGARAELLMMACVFLGYMMTYFWPLSLWSLYCLAIGAGMGFVRPCVTLHAQAACQGDVDSLTIACKSCGAARSFADVCSFAMPSAVYARSGWRGVTVFGASLSVCYLVVSARIHLRLWFRPAVSDLATVKVESTVSREGRETLVEQNIYESSRMNGSHWIDWVLAGAFVSTELQWNLLNTAVPAALVDTYQVPTAAVGAIVSGGSLVAFIYLLALPFLPSAFNRQRPVNLIITCSWMALSWAIMLIAVCYVPVWLFAFGSYLFLVAANASQIVMLECLTGVCDLETSTRIMGMSEMVGCAFGMFGTYAGVGLKTFGAPMPFLFCGLYSFASASILVVSLGRRRNEIKMLVPCSTVDMSMENVACQASGPEGTPELKRTLSGLRSILYRSDTFISAENSYRSCGQELTSRSQVDDEQPLLPAQILALSEVSSPGSCQARGRQIKRLTAGFEYAFVDLDLADHEVCLDPTSTTSKLTRFISLDEDLVRSHACSGSRSQSVDSYFIQPSSPTKLVFSLPPL